MVAMVAMVVRRAVIVRGAHQTLVLQIILQLLLPKLKLRGKELRKPIWRRQTPPQLRLRQEALTGNATRAQGMLPGAPPGVTNQAAFSALSPAAQSAVSFAASPAAISAPAAAWGAITGAPASQASSTQGLENALAGMGVNIGALSSVSNLSQDNPNFGASQNAAIGLGTFVQPGLVGNEGRGTQGILSSGTDQFASIPATAQATSGILPGNQLVPGPEGLLPENQILGPGSGLANAATGEANQLTPA